MNLPSFLVPIGCALTLISHTMQANSFKIVAFGDSLTAPRDGVKVYSDVIEEELTKGGTEVVFVNKGIPGNTAQMGAERFSRDVLSQNADVVVIMFGINDSMIDVWKNPPETLPRVSKADYEKNLRFFVSETRKAGGRPILMTPSQMRWTQELKKLYGKPPYNAEEERGLMVLLPEYADTMRKVAADLKVPLVDIQALYDEWEKTNGSCAALLPDGMHPNSKGHQLVAEALMPTISWIMKSEKP